jgi:ankyrin repeat protein
VNVDVFGHAWLGYTLLHLAGCDGVNSIDYLLDAGAKLDARYRPPDGEQGLTPLEWAKLCFEKHMKSSVYPNPGGSLKGGLDALLAAKQRNVSTQQRKAERNTSRACIAARESYEWATQLRDDDAARASYAAKYPLHAAVAANNISEVKSLIETHSVDVNAVDDKNLTSLQYGLDCDALERGIAGGYCGARINQQTAEYLVRKGANLRLDFAVRGELQRGFTLLHYAVSRGSTDLVKLLLKAGADPNAVWVHTGGEGQVVEKEGSYTPLTVAAQCIS